MNNKYTKSSKKSKEYQILKKNFQIFIKKNTILSGIIPIDLCYKNFFKKSIMYVQYYNLYEIISKKKHSTVIFNNFYNPYYFYLSKQLIYFCTKNKEEVRLQFTYLLSCISKNCIIYVIGKKNSGINSIINIFNKYIIFNKVDYARNCCLYQGYMQKKPIFHFPNFIKKYVWNNIIIYSLPGVFGYNKIDQGSKLLISTFTKNIKGKILDLGSGTGIIGISLAKKNPLIDLTLTDIYDTAIWCSKKNLKKNDCIGKVLFSNIYSKINTKYNLIVSNPPFHNNLNITVSLIHKIIKNSTKFLKKRGELRIVISSFISYKTIFKNKNINFNIILKKNRYTIYKIVKQS
ncbi:class I SAM-dependent methyltransferase [Buchnera aphidicola]|uniref:Ribosomal RNA small subunit methyltransferase C n=1 Tax=Buchnera aphidicola (Cinara cf. splendens/pseudotsugae 3390) TaxID=2518980 RepID=A0A451CWS9_9GAMM|nr:class I SAM-dependent methyltransferase [Buchnera aphidicola]VFP77795.1 Ribosomal RNA small subunit methyltransferase C [Buchnera aphidicola (Cinara cf. splendens/pseudotsugae 3390)]